MQKRRPGRPKKEPTVVVGLRMPESLRDELAREAHDADRSMNQQIIHLLRNRSGSEKKT